MNLRRTLLLFSFIFAGSLAIAQPKDRWTIQDDGAIRWNINDNILYYICNEGTILHLL